MIALYIILGILLLLFLLTLFNVWIYAVYNEELSLTLRIAFVKLRLLPPKPKKKKPKKKKPTQQKKKKTTEKKEPKKEKSFDFKAYVKEKGVSGLLNIIKQVANLAVGALKDLFSKITVTKLSLKLRIAGEDAADSAVKYGQTCAVLYPALKIITEVVTVREYNIDVEPDFSDDPKNLAQAEVIAKIRVISILAVIFKHAIKALKLLLKARPKHSKTNNDNKIKEK